MPALTCYAADDSLRASWLRLRPARALLSGLAIYLLPFSLFNQHSVVLHTLVGVLFLLPFVVYLLRHIRAYWTYPSTHVKFSGYAAGLMAVVCCLSGVVLAYEGALGTSITYLWRTTHILTTFGVLLFLGAHLGTLWFRARRGAAETAEGSLRVALRGHSRMTVGVMLALFATTGGMSQSIRCRTLFRW